MIGGFGNYWSPDPLKEGIINEHTNFSVQITSSNLEFREREREKGIMILRILWREKQRSSESRRCVVGEFSRSHQFGWQENISETLSLDY